MAMFDYDTGEEIHLYKIWISSRNYIAGFGAGDTFKIMRNTFLYAVKCCDMKPGDIIHAEPEFIEGSGPIPRDDEIIWQLCPILKVEKCEMPEVKW